MPADYDELFTAFADLVGTGDAQEVYPGVYAADADAWIDMFQTTGIDFESHEQTVDAFENFLIAFYPQEGYSKEDWDYTRLEFYYMYGIDESNIDWEAYRDNIDS